MKTTHPQTLLTVEINGCNVPDAEELPCFETSFQGTPLLVTGFHPSATTATCSASFDVAVAPPAVVEWGTNACKPTPPYHCLPRSLPHYHPLLWPPAVVYNKEIYYVFVLSWATLQQELAAWPDAFLGGFTPEEAMRGVEIRGEWPSTPEGMLPLPALGSSGVCYSAHAGQAGILDDLYTILQWPGVEELLLSVNSSGGAMCMCAVNRICCLIPAQH